MAVGLAEPLADDTLGQHDREDQDRHHAAGVEQELDAEQERGVEEQEDAAGGDQGHGQEQDAVEEVRGEHDSEA